MNSFIVMAEIVQDPQLRYTSDTQTPIAEMMVQFPGIREEDRPAVMKVVGWGNLAQEIQDQYRVGDRVIIEGRLGMNSVDRPEGFKEKRAELTASRVHKVTAEGGLTSSAMAQPAAAAPRTAEAPARAAAPAPRAAAPAAKSKPAPQPVAAANDIDYDDIPF